MTLWGSQSIVWWLFVASSLLQRVSAFHFRDCWLLFGELNDIGYSHATNLARLELNLRLRDKYGANNTFETVAYPNTFFMGAEARELIINQSIADGCHLIVASSDPLLNGKEEEYVKEFRNVSFIHTTGTPTSIEAVNYRNHVGNWFDISFVSGAVAAAVSTRCAAFINAFEDRQSTWSHAMAFTLGYKQFAPADQSVHVVTMEGYYNPSSEVLAAQLLVERKGCDVFGRHTDPNDVDQYIHSLGGDVLSMARYVDMSTFVGDTVFTSIRERLADSFYPLVEETFLSRLTKPDVATFWSAGSITPSNELTPFTSAVNITRAKEYEQKAYNYLETENPLCDQAWRSTGESLSFERGTCVTAIELSKFPSYLALDNVFYYDAFQDGGALCGAGTYYEYDEALAVSCVACPDNTFYDGNSRASTSCISCPEGTVSTIGSTQCIKISSDPNPAAIWVPLVCLFLFLLGIAFYFRRSHGQRDNTRAPKNSHQTPICILFTDIQASTTIWANAPEVMAKAIEIHHKLIRKAIHRHQGYEVKTIGDAFMIVHGSPRQALRLALDIQRDLFQHDWQTEELDQIYQLIDDESSSSLDLRSQYAAAANYNKSWNGLRVRIGISYGTCRGEMDAVTKGWDFYGNVVNMGARVEAAGHGGQILLTGAAYNALVGQEPATENKKVALAESPELPEDIKTELGALRVKHHGEVQLRGLSTPTELLEVVPNQISPRAFPPLRVDLDIPMDGDTDDDSAQSDSADGADLIDASPDDQIDGLIRIAMKTAGISVYDSDLVEKVKGLQCQIKSLLSLYSLKEKQKLLNDLMERWYLSMPQIDDHLLNQVGANQIMILILSVRVATVSEASKMPFSKMKGMSTKDLMHERVHHTRKSLLHLESRM